MNRDVDHERHLVGIAALSCGLAAKKDGRIIPGAAVEALNVFSDRRAWAGGVDVDGRAVSLPDEAAQELADCRSYLIWLAQSVLDGAIEGDAVAAETYKRSMAALAHVLQAWTALITV